MVKYLRDILGSSYNSNGLTFNPDLDDLEAISFFDKKRVEYNSPVLIHVDIFKKKRAVVLSFETEKNVK